SYAVEEGENIVVRSDFENEDTDKWAVFGGGSIAVDNTVSHSGESSLKITDRGDTFHGPSLHCDNLFNSGEVYNFEGWVYHETGETKSISWAVRYTDALGANSYARINGAEVESGEWTKLSNSIIIPDNAISYLIYFECADVATDFYIDDVTITGNSAVQSEKKTDKMQEEYFFDFETSSEIWAPRGEITVVNTDEYSSTGSHSIYVTNRTAVWNGPTLLISDKIRKNESYYYSADVMYNGSEYESSHVFRLEMQYNLNGSDVYELIGEKEIKKNKWTTISGYYIVPEGAENFSIYVQTNNLEEGAEPTDSDLMSFYVDSVRIVEGSIMKKSNMLKMAIITGISVLAILILFFVTRKIIKRIKKNHTALELVSVDAMTKVFNRNSYEKKIAELETDKEQCKSLYYALCDVNFLKYINDNYGHDKGDEAITRCANMLSKVLGSDGKVYRIGGDEFVCIAKSPINDRIRNVIKAESAIDKGYPFAVACGFAEYDENTCTDIKSIISHCDKEMYTDKQRIKSENAEFSRK
ncbi:MAG: carbohydrate binding domain-containing protein, partial [Ruminococcus sp.]|nr:carbohydrate binding domain-containing protein [Ruminococcus sp.]